MNYLKNISLTIKKKQEKDSQYLESLNVDGRDTQEKQFKSFIFIVVP